MALGLVQIGSQLVRRKPVGTIEWLSLSLIIAAGTGTLLTGDPRFVLFKPSVLYAIAGVVMLKQGWMNRYLPGIARAVGSDVAAVLGFVWAALMFVSAAVSALVALTCSIATWALTMSVFGIVSKVAVFLVGFAAMRVIVVAACGACPPWNVTHCWPRQDKPQNNDFDPTELSTPTFVPVGYRSNQMT